MWLLVQMDLGKERLREILGADLARFNDFDLETALWETYYDIDQAVDYLLSMLSLFCFDFSICS